MWLEFRDWKLVRCLTAVAPSRVVLRHSGSRLNLSRKQWSSGEISDVGINRIGSDVTSRGSCTPLWICAHNFDGP